MGLIQRIVAAVRSEPQNAVSSSGLTLTPELEAALLGRLAGRLPWQEAIQITTAVNPPQA